MNVMASFTKRNLLRNRKWAVVTIIGLIISTSMITAVSTFVSSFQTMLQRDAQIRQGNWHAMANSVEYGTAEKAASDKSIKEVFIAQDNGYALLPDSDSLSNPYLFVRALDTAATEHFTLHLTEGRLPENGGEIVIPEHLFSIAGIKYRVGDTLTLELGRRLSPEGGPLNQNNPYQFPREADPEHDVAATQGERFIADTTRTYTVVGIIRRPGFEHSWSPGFTCITGLDPGTLRPEDRVDLYLLAPRISRAMFADIPAALSSLGIGEDRINFNSELLRYYGVIQNDNLQGFLYGFALVIICIIIVASVSLIYNAFAISVAERTRQLGLLASVGATRRQKRQNVYLEGFFIALIGIPLGVLAGIGGIGVTLWAIRPLMDSFVNMNSGVVLMLSVSPLAIAASVVFSLLTVMISSYIPARRAARIMPIDAIRQTKEIKLTRKKVRTSGIVRLLFGFEGDIALKNLKRNRKKFRATVVSMVISLVLFITVSYYVEMTRTLSIFTTDGYNFDVGATYYDDTPQNEIDRINEAVHNLQGVTESSYIRSVSGSVPVKESEISPVVRDSAGKTDSNGYNLYGKLVSPDDAAFDIYAKSLGIDPAGYRDAANPRAIVVNIGKGYVRNRYTSDRILQLHSGDTLSLDIDGSKAPIKIGVLTDIRPMGLPTQSLSNLNIIVSREVYDALLQNFPDGIAEEHFFCVNTTDADGAEKEMTRQSSELRSGGLSVMNIVSISQSEKNLMTFMGVFIYGFIILISLICVANILNTISTNIMLRRKEFAMLRSVGMTPKSFGKMIRFESIFYGINALLYGLPISAAVGFLLYLLQKDSFDIGIIVPWTSYAVAIVLIFAVVGASMLYSISRIKKENIIDALKLETM